MENIIKLLEATGVLALICVGFVSLLYPIMFVIKFKENFGKNYRTTRNEIEFALLFRVSNHMLQNAIVLSANYTYG